MRESEAEMSDDKVTVGYRLKFGEMYIDGNMLPVRRPPAPESKDEIIQRWANYSASARLIRVTRRKRVSVEGTIGFFNGPVRLFLGYATPESSSSQAERAGFRDGDRVRINRLGAGK